MQIAERGFKKIEPQDLIDYRIFNDNIDLIIAELKKNDTSVTSFDAHIKDTNNPHKVTLTALNGASKEDIKKLQDQIDTINKYFGGILERKF